MKTIVTTVGTSIFTNYQKENGDSNDKIEDLKLKQQSEWDNYKDDVNSLEKTINKWLNGNDSASAEIKSLIKIEQMLKNPLEVYLLTTDTILSNIAADIIKEYFNQGKEIKIKSIELIKELQIKNSKKFAREGLTNLIRRIEKISNNYFENVIFNIIGGYKAVIPYMTIMAQINGCDIYYIFEDTDNLIKIPKTPIKVDDKLIDDNYKLIKEIDKGIDNYKEFKDKHYAEIDKISGFIETDGKCASLSPIGRIFLTNYAQKYFTIYTPDDVWKNMQKKQAIKNILETKFCFEEQRKSQTEEKNNHFVFDDGNNQNRIFYFKKSGNIYVYKVFTVHDNYSNYLNTNKLDKEKVMTVSKKRKVEIKRRNNDV